MKYKYKSLILYILYINIRFLYSIPNIYFYKNLIEYRNSINKINIILLPISQNGNSKPKQNI